MRTLALLLALAPLWQARVVRVIDGDTVQVTVATWPQHAALVDIRLGGINAPEISHPKCEAERALGLKAKAALEALAPVGSSVFLSDLGVDKFGGRFDAAVRDPNGRDINAAMIASGLAVKYGVTKNWCAR